MPLRVDVVFDVHKTTPYYQPTLDAIDHAIEAIGADATMRVVRTDTLSYAYFDDAPDAIVIGPGSPYRRPDLAEDVVAGARERGIPLVGTWAGFQHVLVEHARSQLGIDDAAHAEYGPGGTPIVSLLECSINGADITLEVTPGSVLAAAHGGAEPRVEHTTCNYGLDLAVQHIASSGGMAISAIDDLGEVRAVELEDHPYFVATLYQPQLRSHAEAPHPVFVGLIEACRLQ